MLLGNAFGAGDVVHEAYLRIARRPDRFLGHPQPYAYAFTTMANIVRDEWRRDRRRVLRPEPGAAAERAGTADCAGAAAAAGGVRGARAVRGGGADPAGGGVDELQAHWEVVRLLRCLTVKQARAVALVDLDGYSMEEAAELLGVHRSTLAVTRRRALVRLRAVLEREREAGAGSPGGQPGGRSAGTPGGGADAPN
ncbi:sigma-70 family RNA polymerase sigma factor [Kitasatospora sp. NPDC093806]|uniref:RNA polymerase sigma factor n=1 Tax=Kitasatospora sp. NPDC093806 TaxID=3155075 RepID=UPI003422C87D